jgi:YD repeat-containing protein
MPLSQLTAVQPHRAIEGGRVTIKGGPFRVDGPEPPEVRIGDLRARVVCASSNSLTVLVPAGLAEGGRLTVKIAGFAGETAFLDVAAPCASGLHQVDNPVFDADGNLYVTYSGTRGQQVPVSIFRVRPNGTRETFSSAVVNPTSMAIDPEGRLYVSSRFEGVVYRLDADGSAQPFARELGVACGLAFDGEGTLHVGDRSGTIFKVDRAGHASPFATLPSSVAAFHLAFGPDRCLYATGPTLSPYDAVYRVNPDGRVTRYSQRFGRPQGLAFDANGALFVVEALAGDSGLYRVPGEGDPELVLAGPGLIGVAFDPRGGVVVCSNDTAYRLPDWSA